MNKRNLLLIVDAQNDFCVPGGALYVKGAEMDVERISAFIERNRAAISEIIFTQDKHHKVDISHQAYWQNSEGEHPKPYTTITLQDVEDGLWSPLYDKTEASAYLEKLEAQGEFLHTIWPDHCIVGSQGAEIVEALLEICRGCNTSTVDKGLNPQTEHFGALRANIEIEGDRSTALNGELVERLKSADSIYVCGEAKSHCVAYTIKQMCEIEGLIAKTTLIDDACSDVQGFEGVAEPIYQRASEMGMTREFSIYINL